MESEDVEYFVLLLICTIVGIFITRAIFSIPKFLRYQRAKLKLQALQARQAGVDEEAIKAILNESDKKFADHNDHFSTSTNFYAGEAKEAIKQTQ